MSDRMPQVLAKMQHMQAKGVLCVPRKAGEDVPKRLASYALVLSDLSQRDSRAHEWCKEQDATTRFAVKRRGSFARNRRGRADDLVRKSRMRVARW